MLTFTFSNGGSIEKLIVKLSKPLPMNKIGKTVQDDIIEETKRRGWKRPAGTIKRRTVDKNTQEIFIGGKAKDAMVSGFLHSGTKSHFIRPVKKAALHWSSNGVRFFSKGHWVRGIKPTNFFSIYPKTLSKIQAIVTEHYK